MIDKDILETRQKIKEEERQLKFRNKLSNLHPSENNKAYKNYSKTQDKDLRKVEKTIKEDKIVLKDGRITSKGIEELRNISKERRRERIEELYNTSKKRRRERIRENIKTNTAQIEKIKKEIKTYESSFNFDNIIPLMIGAIGLGIVLMVGYLVITQVTEQMETTAPEIDTIPELNNATSSVQTTIFAGFGFVAVGIIVLAAFSLINIFK